MLSLLFIFPMISSAQKPNSVLWKVTGRKLTKPSYLFGTFHIASYELLDSFPQVKKIIASCDYGLFEKGEKSIGEWKDAEIYTPPLDSVFSRTEYLLVDSFFTHSPFGSIVPYNNEASLPAMLQVVLMINGNADKKQDMFFDDYLQLYMEDLHKETFMLDDREEMARSAAKENWKLIAEAIVYLIKNDVQIEDIDFRKQFDKHLYCSLLINDMRLDVPATDSLTINGTIERNLIWLPKIVTKMNEGSCFVAVGLAHLQYKTGLIQLLRKEGYTVKPVRLRKKK